MSAEVRNTQVAVVGGGPGGYAAAFRAADLGLDTTLIDLDPNPGGTCLYRGCIPSKALLHVAKVITDAQEADAYGIRFQPPEINLEKLRRSVDGIVRKLTGGLGQLCRLRKIDYIQGRGKFLDSDKLKVYKHSGEEIDLRFERAILATGSRPALLESLLVESARVMNSTTALQMPEIPSTLLVIGGGYIGLELGSVYATLGSKVTIVEATPNLLTGTDRNLVDFVERRMQRLMHDIILGAQVNSMKEVENGILVEFDGPDVEDSKQVFEKVLISIGRRPNSSGVGLRSTKVEVDDRGYVLVDEQRRTSDPRILAIGDITGQPMLAHKATHEGRVAAEVIAGQNSTFEPRAIPAVVFTDPEIAWAGLTETEAAREGRPIRVAKFPWQASGRATTLQRNDGLTKIIADPDTDQVLGVGIVGPGAGELISEGALAIEMGALASDIEMTIHPHPTLGETIMESAEIIFGSSTHYKAR
jgi:dihydrolipoamide dehydrogenase